MTKINKKITKKWNIINKKAGTLSDDQQKDGFRDDKRGGFVAKNSTRVQRVCETSETKEYRSARYQKFAELRQSHFKGGGVQKCGDYLWTRVLETQEAEGC